MKRLACIALCLAGCYEGPSRLVLPPDAPPPAAPDGCETLARFAVAHHPTLRAARAGLAVTQAEAEALSAPAPPSLRVRDDVRDPGRRWRVGLEVPFGVPGERSARAAQGRAEVHLGEAALRLAEVEVAAAARDDHVAWRRARAAHDDARRRAEEAEAQVEMVQARVGAGTATTLALEAARLNARAARADTAGRPRGLAEAAARVRAWAEGAAVGDAACAPAPDAPTSTPRAGGARAAWRARHAAAAAEARAAWPFFDRLEVMWDAETSGDDRLLVGLEMPLPWFGRRAEADAAAAWAVAAEAQVAAAAARAVRDAVVEAEAAVGAAAAAAAIHADAADAEALLLRAADAPTRAAEVLALRRALRRLRQRVDAAALDLEAAHVALRRARGLP
ncbi:MAG: TolC family protein [Myxococcales bacterium]|nr:TolC family protein [Myxococcales bacterium]